MFEKWPKGDLYVVRLFVQIISDKETQKIFTFKKLEPSICDN